MGMTTVRVAMRLLVIFGVAAPAGTAQQPQGPDIVARHIFVMTAPPKRVPSPNVVDGPILGNGDLGIAIGGPPEEQSFYFGKNDFWSQQQVVLSVGGLKLKIPDLAGASYRQEQDIRNGEVRGIFAKGGATVRMRTWAAAMENLAVTELSVEGGSGFPATAMLFPEAITLKDNDKPVNLGREQTGDGRWYFEGLLDEVQVFDRALQGADIRALGRRERVKAGLVRRWGFESDEGTTPQDTPARLVLGRDCQGPAEVLRSIERPTPEPTRCLAGGYNHNYQRYGLDIDGRVTGTSRAVLLQHEYAYVDAGTIPGMKDQVSVSAWIYIYSAGDQNFILSKGAWNEAYALTLDRGRLRFNVGEHFARTDMPAPVQRWVHVVGTFDDVQIRVYVDGVEEIPRARYISGGATRDMLWRSRNADGPLDQQFAWESPLPPSSSPTVKGREITFATRVIGAETKLAGDALQFELQPGATVYLVSSVLSDLDDSQHVKAAQARVQAATPAELQKLNSALRDWWKNFWAESFVEIGDKVLEKFYYMSQYLIASAARTGKVAPGLYGPWMTVDTPYWNGDYTLDYNHQMPYYGLYSSNHVAVYRPVRSAGAGHDGARQAICPVAPGRPGSPYTHAYRPLGDGTALQLRDLHGAQR